MTQLWWKVLILYAVQKLKNYNLNTAPGADLTQNIPVSAEFLQIGVQYNYRWAPADW
jgi:hypothetical protein